MQNIQHLSQICVILLSHFVFMSTNTEVTQLASYLSDELAKNSKHALTQEATYNILKINLFKLKFTCYTI